MTARRPLKKAVPPLTIPFACRSDDLDFKPAWRNSARLEKKQIRAVLAKIRKGGNLTDDDLFWLEARLEIDLKAIVSVPPTQRGGQPRVVHDAIQAMFAQRVAHWEQPVTAAHAALAAQAGVSVEAIKKIVNTSEGRKVLKEWRDSEPTPDQWFFSY